MSNVDPAKKAETSEQASGQARDATRATPSAPDSPGETGEGSVFAGLEGVDPETRQDIIDEVTAQSLAADPL